MAFKSARVLAAAAVAAAALACVVSVADAGTLSAQCASLPTEHAQIACMASLLQKMDGVLEPRAPLNMDTWPGMDVCVSCRFFLSLLIVAAECAVVGGAAYLWCRAQSAAAASGSTAAPIVAQAVDEDDVHLPTAQPVTLGSRVSFFSQPTHRYVPVHTADATWVPMASPVHVATVVQAAPRAVTRRQALVAKATTVSGTTLAIAGFAYWCFIVAFYWNFISWAMLAGLVLVVPTVAIGWSAAPSDEQVRRLKAGAWLLGALTFLLFPNLSIMPTQAVRHIWKSETILTPADPVVLALRDKFYSLHPMDQFQSAPFPVQMQAVDDFIKAEIPWVEDFALYKVVGLLVTPADVIAHNGGDCQGQAVTTASLLLSMGFNAAVVETPFHWWTHAWNNATGQEWNLNVHGSAGALGSVTPQPIDMVVTQYPAKCSDCPATDMFNDETYLYVRPPWSALANAWTGMHEVRRDFVPVFQGKEYLLAVVGAVLGVVSCLYSSYIQNDIQWAAAPLGRMARRLVLGVVLSMVPTFGMYGWAFVYYPVTFMHMIFTFSVALCATTWWQLQTPASSAVHSE